MKFNIMQSYLIHFAGCFESEADFPKPK